MGSLVEIATGQGLLAPAVARALGRRAEKAGREMRPKCDHDRAERPGITWNARAPHFDLRPSIRL